MRALTFTLVVLSLVACDRGEHRAAREKYNEGVALLAKGDFAAAETALLDARNQAGVDPELRYRAAYDLGLAYAAESDKTKVGDDADLGKALEQGQHAVTWLFDATQQRPHDDDATQSLAAARARVRALEDQLAKSGNALEARLDALIHDQRDVLDQARAAWAAIKQTHGADPLAQQSALVHLADRERGIIAEAGVIGDLAGEEIDAIGKKPDDKRDEKEKARVVQLKNLDIYLLDGRGKLVEARAKLQQLVADEGVARAEAALVSLKRAREQLLDPIQVLRTIAADQVELLQYTHAVTQASSMLAKDRPDIPAWLAPAAQAERQGALHDRADEVRARLAAGSGQEGKTDEEKRLLARVAAALPHVTAASTAMDTARGSLADAKLDAAESRQKEALTELGEAIEQFADLKQTIDLAAETQHVIVDQLGQKAKEAVDGLAQNLGRMTRIKELIAEASAEAEQKAKATPAPAPAQPAAGSGSGSEQQQDPKQAEAEAMKQQLAQAEVLRGDAEKALAATNAAIKANKDPVASAKQAADKLDKLRELFFNLIEHLQQLIRDQGETRDRTSQADSDDDFTRAPKLPELVSRQARHDELADAITKALAQQADAANKQPHNGGPKPPQAGPSGKQLADAAEEVRLAHNDMADASVVLGKAKDAQQSVSLKPAADSQGKAVEHLENALKLLQPPKQKQGQKDQQQQQQQQQQQKDQQQKDQDQQAQRGGAGQRARDEDARQHKKQTSAPTEPVDQDW